MFPWKWNPGSKLAVKAYKDHEGEGLPGPFLGHIEDVMPTEHVGQGDTLDLAYLCVHRLPQDALVFCDSGSSSNDVERQTLSTHKPLL